MLAVGTDVTVSSIVWLSVGPAGPGGQASPGKTEGPPPWNAGNDRHPYYLPPPQVPASREDAKDAYSCYLIPAQGSGEKPLDRCLQYCTGNVITEVGSEHCGSTGTVAPNRTGTEIVRA